MADKIVALRAVLDIEGQALAVVDPLGRTCMSHVYAVKQTSIDAGTRWSLSSSRTCSAPLFRAWDAVGHRTRVEVDVLQRPTHVWIKKGSDDEWLATRVLHGESFGCRSCPDADARRIFRAPVVRRARENLHCRPWLSVEPWRQSSGVVKPAQLGALAHLVGSNGEAILWTTPFMRGQGGKPMSFMRACAVVRCSKGACGTS